MTKLARRPWLIEVAGGLWVIMALAGCDNVPDKREASGLPTSAKSFTDTLDSCSGNSFGEVMPNHDIASDIRVVVLGDSTMFLPVSLITHYLIDDVKDNPLDFDPAWEKILRGKFYPDICRNEPVGIVHRFAVGERTSRYGALAFKVTSIPQPVLSFSDTLPKVKEVVIGVRADEAPLSSKFRETLPAGVWTKRPGFPVFETPDHAPAHGLCTAAPGTPSSEWVISRYVTPQVRIGLVIAAQANEPSPEWLTLCEGLLPLFKWLSTPPSDRKS